MKSTKALTKIRKTAKIQGITEKPCPAATRSRKEEIMMANHRREEYAQTLSRLIQAQTVSCRDQTDLSAFYAFHQLLRETFPHLFAVCEYEDFSGAMLLRWKGSDSKKLPLLFMNHHDVVEAAGPWKYPPFSGTVADGKVWGRGTLDTKGGLWAMLQAAEELAAEGFVPAQDIYFESARDEENDSLTADAISQELVRRGIRFSLVLDEGGMVLSEPIPGAKGTFAMIGVAEKSYIDMKFTARSSGGHASTPGKNTPLVRLGRFMAEIEDRSPFTAEVSPAVAEMLRRVAPSVDGALGGVLSRADKMKWLLQKAMPKVSPVAGAMIQTTLAFTMAQGSEGRNVLPQEAWVIGNMRCSHHQGCEGSVAAVKQVADKYGIEVEILEDGFPSPVSDYNSEAFRTVERAIRSVYPDVVPAPYIMTGATDSRFMSRVCDNCLRFLPFKVSDEQVESIHGLNENVDVESLVPAVDFYKFIMKGN